MTYHYVLSIFNMIIQLAVSYTHLDVYKRQVVEDIPSAKNWMDIYLSLIHI
uniref:Uncharacterized protein n=1 Tax=Candidatus Enterococcus dunnyi TaxID=1834192 RepID=A0A200J061_9ENTE|nr:hypothetical protein A5889_002866 [Enterococcus sp. 9D6_DIV0238]